MKTQTIQEALGYAVAFRGTTVLIKVGGACLAHPQVCQAICADIALLWQLGIQVVIVHGGGKAINRALAKQQVVPKFIQGLRVTSAEDMQTIAQVLVGEVNQQFMTALHGLGVPCVSLSGSSHHILQAMQQDEALGQVGVVEHVNPLPIQVAMGGNHAVPVIAPIGVSQSGNLLNINADIAAAHIASSLSVDKLIYLTDQDGIYDAHQIPISILSDQALSGCIIDGLVTDGMLIKAKAILSALNANLSAVHILNGMRPHVLIDELFTQAGVGTLCQKTSKEEQAA